MLKAEQVERVIKLYSGQGWKSIFASIRFWDAPYLELEEIVPSTGEIVDIGCGEGFLSNFLGLTSSERKVLGLEVDAKRVAIADRGVSNVSFLQGDATNEDIPSCDAIIFFNSLHHFESYADQEKVITRGLRALKSGGKLICVEIDVKPSLKFLITWLTDHFLVPILFERKLYTSRIYFRKKDEWIRLLEKNGLECVAFPAEKGKPFTHFILIGSKP